MLKTFGVLTELIYTLVYSWRVHVPTSTARAPHNRDRRTPKQPRPHAGGFSQTLCRVQWHLDAKAFICRRQWGVASGWLAKVNAGAHRVRRGCCCRPSCALVGVVEGLLEDRRRLCPGSDWLAVDEEERHARDPRARVRLRLPH